MKIVDIRAGTSMVRLTKILDIKIFLTDTGRLFIIQRFFPSIDIEAMVVQDVAIQKVISIGMISWIIPDISIPSIIELGSMNGKAIAVITNIITPNPVFITYMLDAK